MGDAGVTLNVQVELGCVMVNACPAIVSVAVLVVAPVFVPATKLTLPGPLPDKPLVIATHDAPLDEVQPQPAAVVTVTVPLPPLGSSVCVVGEIVNVQDAVGCVTVYVWPPIVMVPVRLVAPVFAATL